MSERAAASKSEPVPSRDKMLVIGAGPVGLACAKALKAAGIAYDQVEADKDLGGNWRHGVYDTLHIVTSKRTTQFSDFPMPEHYPDFPDRNDMLAYFEAYAETFDLRAAIAFETKVIWVRPVEQNLYEITLESGERRHYKGVLVCSGQHWDRQWPSLPGMFTGEYLHSKDYKDPAQLKDKRVLVIGEGTSAFEVVSEAARWADQASLSVRQGVWILPKTLLGRPLTEVIKPSVPVWLQKPLLRTMIRIANGPNARYGLPLPGHDLFDKPPVINSEVLHHLKHGAIAPRPAVRGFDGNRVTFLDGRNEDYDLVICATGYQTSYPFLPRALAPMEGGRLQTYGGSMLADYRHLYLIGGDQACYGLGPLVSEAAALTAKLIALQDGLAHPIGGILKAMGMKPGRAAPVDPHRNRRILTRLRNRLRLLPYAERYLLRQEATDNKVLDELDPLSRNDHRPMTVF